VLPSLHGRARARNELPRSAGRSVLSALTLLAIAAAFQVGQPVLAAEAEDRAQLAACVDRHMTADDLLIMRRLVFLTMSDVLQTDADLQGDAVAKRDTVSAGAAGLITRMVEQDCKAEVHALTADKPQGGVFKVLFDDIGKPMQTTLTAGMPKAGAAMGLGIMKKLDAATIADVQSVDSTPGTPTGAPASQNLRLNRAAVSGVRLRLAFETALNPDCSVLGQTVIRSLKSPSHGTATIEDTKDFTAYEAANQRYHCNEKRVPGTAIYYKSAREYTGPDSASYEIIYPSGIRRQVDVDITVN
jgi:hypothetical protein